MDESPSTLSFSQLMNEPIEVLASFQHNIPKEICAVFNQSQMTFDELDARINELIDSIQTDENIARQIRTEIDSIKFDREEMISKVKQKKYQLSVSQQLLDQVKEDIKVLQHEKRNILVGDYEGQITLEKAQKKDIFSPQKNTFHAIKYLAKEVNFPLIAESRAEIANLFREIRNTYFSYHQNYQAQGHYKKSVEEKLSLIQKQVIEKRELVKEMQFELNQMEVHYRMHQNRNLKKIHSIPESWNKNVKQLRKNERDCLIQIWNTLKIISTEGYDEVSLDRYTRVSRRNIIDLANKLIMKREQKKRQYGNRIRLYQMSISSFHNIITEIKEANYDVIKKTEDNISDSCLD
ncbi:hypothetical protein TRFO_14850 [Tritrichomonas foetus]|uniref:Uncharacterized protein n=1 Tax=Tritrichomonas foetus TaxID=1144522 RepID=A0A1J4KY89_9EUKA|nr:hypothetical protein TRFO_14850 [Tritrichomonas foetus]|eukprot:OHT14678.1 hypothetical protein TRFO_14850 [Tritrichomonas foetus]